MATDESPLVTQCSTRRTQQAAAAAVVAVAAIYSNSGLPCRPSEKQRQLLAPLATLAPSPHPHTHTHAHSYQPVCIINTYYLTYPPPHTRRASRA